MRVRDKRKMNNQLEPQPVTFYLEEEREQECIGRTLDVTLNTRCSVVLSQKELYKE